MAGTLEKENKGKKQVATVNNQAIYGVRIVGATLNKDGRTLLEIINASENTNDVRFCALTGMFYLIAQDGADLRELLRLEYRDRIVEKINKLLKKFEAILLKKEYAHYPVAVLPGSGVSDEQFLSESFRGTLRVLFFEVFHAEKSWDDKDREFAGVQTVQNFFKMVIEHEFINSKTFFEKTVTEQMCNLLDDLYTTSLSNTKGKIWDSKRAAREYFIRKLILFNPIVPEKTRTVIGKRWQAWFLLEDSYKESGKSVNRKNLTSEMKVILKEL